MFQSIVRKIVGSKNDRDLKRLWPIVDEINQLEAGLEALSNDALRAKTGEFRERLAQGAELDDLLPGRSRSSARGRSASSACATSTSS